ncbi:hypothetical protein RF11_16457 [Thelohanellus kitauei]|uniref:Uncharacterized protein n=1 Tax=Thelohanellus kitauei TaxID=669202 RepID=A0A0C2MZD5_THEKT|nr:hypothetical protein RF11_16457 [Thelohanellus kitauei]
MEALSRSGPGLEGPVVVSTAVYLTRALYQIFCIRISCRPLTYDGIHDASFFPVVVFMLSGPVGHLSFKFWSSQANPHNKTISSQLTSYLPLTSDHSTSRVSDHGQLSACCLVTCSYLLA